MQVFFHCSVHHAFILFQLVMARLQRVTFVALHQHLGLASELIRNASELQIEEGSVSKVNETKRSEDEV